MNNILEAFYNQIIPGLLKGEIDCEILIHIIANIFYEEDNQLLSATNKYEGVIIPTLVIKNRNIFNQILTEYVETTLDYYEDVHLASIDKDYYPAYIIAMAIANMGPNDYLNPELYFKQRILAIKENQFTLTSEKQPIGLSDEFNSDMYYVIDKEKTNEECPFKFTLFLESDDDFYEFQTIRFFINDETAYIGAIQGNKPDEQTNFQKKTKRTLYKANEGITPENKLYQTNPGSVVCLTAFIALLNSYGINKITILPYAIQRWNDKRILYHNLKDRLINNQAEPFKLKVTQVLERTSSYFDKTPIIRKQLQNSLLRFHYHLGGSSLAQDNELPLIICNQISNGNNTLLNNIYGQVYNSNNKKTNHYD